MREASVTKLISAAAAACLLAVAQGSRAADSKDNPYFRTATSTTAGSVTVEGHTIRYHAIAGLLIVHPKCWNDAADAKGKSPESSMFYVAYFKDGENPSDRPVTFLYNGGPGSPSVWLHMGAFGPRRVVTADHTHTPPAPYQLVNNHDDVATFIANTEHAPHS